MSTMRFRLHAGGRTRGIEVPISVAVIAGWTGRSRDEVDRHIAELAELGVAPPSRIPLFYRVSASLLTHGDRVQVLGCESSGEVEAVLIGTAEHGMLVGVGSDHTDRKAEAVSVAVSKQLCPKPLGRDLWRFGDVAERWDGLRLESELDGEPYQRGLLADIRPPVDLIADYFEGYKTVPPEFAVFLGTVPAIGGVRPGRSFAGRLADPETGGELAFSYDSVVLPVVA